MRLESDLAPVLRRALSAERSAQNRGKVGLKAHTLDP